MLNSWLFVVIGRPWESDFALLGFLLFVAMFREESHILCFRWSNFEFV